MITPFSSCRKWTTATVLGTLRKKDHLLAAAPIVVAGSDDDDVADGTTSAPLIVLKMYLHCASCAAKVERIVMDIPGVEKVATDVAESRITVTGTADAAVVATSVQAKATEWTAEVRIAGLDCGRCISRIVQNVSRFHGVREIKLTLPDRATMTCRRGSGMCDNPNMNQHLPGPA
ncbi:unnamed protein product [Urochloa decumbens]|uniref:HMA domain-containing protein n=1 Tax=Urochloa decumbens TaxID=240449 RepID=A0ABC8YHM7_9POAL